MQHEPHSSCPEESILYRPCSSEVCLRVCQSLPQLHPFCWKFDENWVLRVARSFVMPAIPVTPCHTLCALTSYIPSSWFSITMPVLAKEVFKPCACLSQVSQCDTWCLKTSRFASLLLFVFLAWRPFPDVHHEGATNQTVQIPTISKPFETLQLCRLRNALHKEGQQKSSKIQAKQPQAVIVPLLLNCERWPPPKIIQDHPRSKTNQNQSSIMFNPKTGAFSNSKQQKIHKEKWTGWFRIKRSEKVELAPSTPSTVIQWLPRDWMRPGIAPRIAVRLALASEFTGSDLGVNSDVLFSIAESFVLSCLSNSVLSSWPWGLLKFRSHGCLALKQNLSRWVHWVLTVLAKVIVCFYLLKYNAIAPKYWLYMTILQYV